MGRGSGWSREWTVGGGTAELEIWAQAWGCVCTLTHTPPRPKEAGAQTAPVWTSPSLLRHPITQGCVLTSCVSRLSLTRSVTLGRALPLRASLSHLYSRG